MDQLLKALRETARAEDRADETALAEVGPAALLDAAARARIASSILEVPTGVVSLAERRRARQRWVTWLAVPLAAAAAVALVVLPRAHRPETLPGYELVASGGLREVRGIDDRPGEVQRLGPHSVLDVKLRPAATLDGPMQVMAFAVQGERADLVQAETTVAPSGAVALRAGAGRVFGDRRGRWELRVLLLRPALAGQAQTLVLGSAATGPGWQRLTVPLELLP